MRQNRHVWPFAMAVAVLSVWAGGARAAVLVGPVVRPATGHRYYLLSQNTWTQAEAEAVTLGGHLVTIDDQPENDWVFNTFSTFAGVDRSLLIGLNDQASEGNFVWAGGEALAFTNWAPSQPDNGSPGPDPPGEDFVHLLWPGHPNAGTWNDFQNLSNLNGFPLNGVVELPTLIGDLDADGFVGITDLNIVLSNWNQNVTTGNPTQGDPSGDGFVGIEDLNTVLGNWNAGILPPAEATSLIPEPATALLLSLGMIGIAGKRFNS